MSRVGKDPIPGSALLCIVRSERRSLCEQCARIANLRVGGAVKLMACFLCFAEVKACASKSRFLEPSCSSLLGSKEVLLLEQYLYE